MKTLKNQKLHSLSLAVALSLSTIACQSAYAADDTTTQKPYQKIGDLEIYQAAKEGKVTITMMLDTSGSMSESAMQDGSACELNVNGGVVHYTLNKTKSNTTPSYDRYACVPDPKGQKKVYFASYIPSWNSYLVCNARGACESSSRYGKPEGYSQAYKEIVYYNRGTLQAEKLYTLTRLTNVEIESIGGLTPKEDRLTRLKDALFAITESADIDPTKVSIGIGQFSTQSDASNQPFSADGRTGKILVPAAPFDETQRQKIREAVAGLVGYNGTPAAQAYAEAGAYMLGGSTLVPGVNSGFNNSVTASKSGNNYISPLPKEPKICDGQGIYFLTDGEPNSSVQPELLMNQALAGKATITNSTTNSLADGSQSEYGMPQAGQFAKALRDANKNPKGVSIRTAVVGFGSVFDTAKIPEFKQELQMPKLDPKTSLPIEGEFEERTGAYFDCSAIPLTQIDARNACNWGAKTHPNLKKKEPNATVGGFGEGGFYSAQSTPDVVASVKDFLNSLNRDIAATPSGTISIPKDPLNASTIQPYAYVPMMQPYVGKNNAIWDGNLKRYHTLFGTLYGQDRQRLYTKNAKATTETKDFPSGINVNARDLWQTETGQGAAIAVGGTRGTLANQSKRTVYIEGKGEGGKAKMIKVQVDGGVLKINNEALNTGHLTAHDYTLEDMAYLVDYLGYNIDKNLSASNNQLNTFQNRLKNATKRAGGSAFGGVAHSVPVLATYEGMFSDQEGIDVDPVKGRNDFLIYGTTEGSLRMAKAADGQEQFAFIPRTIFKEQKKALALGSATQEIGQPYFGVDAPWATSATYNYEDKKDDQGNNSKLIKATKMYAYGGLRMGGVGLYGLNITNPEAPELAFSISKSTAGFERLGQTWVKPTLAKIKTNATSSGLQKDRLKDVLIFGGGYDMCYENPRFELNDTHNIAKHSEGDKAKCTTGKTHAEGNAIYMVDAETGELLESWSPDSSAPGDAAEMKHSFVSEIVTLDRNNNGVVDSIYASDLGGQLFRIDLKEGVAPNAMTRRIVRVFNANEGIVTPLDPNQPKLSDEAIAKRELPFRFYEKPAVSMYDHNKGTLAMVNIASGDRSSPLHKHRNGVEKANRIYGIIDRDLTTFRIGQSGVSNLRIRNLTHEHLHAYKHKEIMNSDVADRKKWLDQLKDANGKHAGNSKTIHGWWYPMTNFDTYTDVSHLKAIGSSIVVGGVLYTSIYSPEYQYTNEDECSAKIVGATERQMFCLPWGICAKDSGEFTKGSLNGTLGFAKAGPGIQELAMTTITSRENTSTNFKTFIGQETLAEAIDNAKKTNTQTGGEGANKAFQGTATANSGDGKNSENVLAQPAIVESSRKLSVERWYDLATAESNQ